MLLAIHFSDGQVLLTSQIPSSGVFMKNQLWNFSVVNSGAGNIIIQIKISFTDVSNGQRIFTASSGYYRITQQFTQLQANNLMPIVYTVVNNSYSVDANPDGFLPIGQFEICIEVDQINGDMVTTVAEDCSTIEIEPISPPILIDPVNEDSSYNNRPFFSWLPPTPVTGINNLSYDFSLVAVETIQSPGDAIQQNIPLFFQTGLNTNFFMYPPSLPELETTKLYAWQVVAKSRNNAVAKSEIFTFKVRDYTLDTVHLIFSEFYVPLRKENDASYTSFGNEIKFEYLNEINDTIASFSIGDISGKDNKIQIDSPFVPLTFGQNFIKMDVSNYSGLITNHIYLLEFINSKKERWYLKFEYRKPE